MNERIGLQLDRHTGANTYKMTTAPKRRGYVQTDRGRSKNILKGGRNRFRTVIMLGLVAFIMLSPQARELWIQNFDLMDKAIWSMISKQIIL